MKILLILVLVTAFANAYPRLPRQQFDDLEPLDEVVTQYQYRSQRYTPSPKLLSARNEYATDDGGLKSAAAPVLPYYRNNYGNNQDDIPDLSGIYSPDGLDSKRFRAVKTESRTQSAGDQVDENEKDPGPAQDKVLQYRTQADPSYYRNLLQNPPSYLINPSSVEASPVHHNAGDKHRDREPPEQLRSIPKEVKKNERTRSLTLGTMDTWWLNIRRALEPLVPPKVMSELDVNVPDGFIVYPFQYPHYLKPQTRRLVFAIPPLFKNTVETKKPAGSQQPLKPLKTYQFLDPPFANYQQSGVRILDQNSLNVNNDLVQPLNLAYQKPNNYDRPFYNEQNNHNLARLKQIRLDEMDQNSAKIVDPEHQAEFEGNDASYVVVDDLYTPADFYTYNIVGM